MSKTEQIDNYKKFWKRGKGYIDKRVTVNPNRDNRVELTIGDQRYAVYSAIPLVAPNDPTFDPSKSTHDKTVSVKLLYDASNLYYTKSNSATAPSEPTEESTAYSGPIVLNQVLGVATQAYTISAMAETNGEHSSTVTKTYYVNGVTSDPIFNLSAGTYTEDSKTITISCTTSGSSIYYKKSNEGTSTSPGIPSTSDTKYTSSLTISGTTTINAIATSTNWKNSNTISKTYTFKTKTPNITLSGNENSATRTVTITCDNSDSSIYYTISDYNGAPSEPDTDSSVYTSGTSIVLDGTKTIRAFATKANRNDSDPRSVTCSFKVKTPTINVIRESSTDYEYDESVSFNIKNTDVGTATIYYRLSGGETLSNTSLGDIASYGNTETKTLTSQVGAKTVTITSYGTRTNRTNSSDASVTITYGRTPFIICTPDPSVASTAEEAKNKIESNGLTLDSMRVKLYIKKSTPSAMNGTYEYNTSTKGDDRPGLFMIMVPKGWGDPKTIKSSGFPVEIVGVGSINNWNCYSTPGGVSAGINNYEFSGW